tara:strand:- start:81 stop:293 length:213 start_codon:yes stop_codon:yes gene_type:complete
MGDYKKNNYTQNQEDNSFATDVNSNFKSKVDLNNLIKRVKEEEKRSKRQNIAISAAALSAIAVFGIILTL